MKEEKECLNSGKKFNPTCHITRRKFCSDACRIEWWKEYHKAHPPEEVTAEECAFCGAPLTGKQGGKRVRLVCGITSMYTGLDGLLAIIRYYLKLDPYDGSVYVFRDGIGSMLKYIEWDGQSFQQGKRRTQSGTYPWPTGQAGSVVELNEREFAYLQSRSIVPFKEEKCCDD